VTKCVKPLRHLETSSTKSSKRSVLISRAGTESDCALSQTKSLSGLAHFVISARLYLDDALALLLELVAPPALDQALAQELLQPLALAALHQLGVDELL